MNRLLGDGRDHRGLRLMPHRIRDKLPWRSAA